MKEERRGTKRQPLNGRSTVEESEFIDDSEGLRPTILRADEIKSF